MKIGVEKGRKTTRGPEDRHLRRARRRSVDSVKFCHKIGLELRQLLALPRADRPPGRGPGGHRRDARRLNVERALLPVPHCRIA